MFPYADFHVDFGAQTGTFAVALRQVSKAGGHLVISVDDKSVAEHDFVGGDADKTVAETITASVPPGKHTIRVENSGADWLVVERFTLAPYGAALRVRAKADAHHALLWGPPHRYRVGCARSRHRRRSRPRTR